MTGSSNASFIPKRNPSKPNRNPGKRNVYIGTVVVNILFVSAIIASVAVYFYQGMLDKDLDEQISLISTTADSFNEAELVRVQSINNLLNHANLIMGQSASFVTILDSIEKSIVDSASIEQMQIARKDDLVEVEAEFNASNFDSILFQQGILSNDQVLSNLTIKDLTLQTVADQSDKNNFDLTGLKFKSLIKINAKDIPVKVIYPTTNQNLDSKSFIESASLDNTNVSSEVIDLGTDTIKNQGNQEII